MAKHVAVLMGGWSSERPVSLRSGAAVADALASKGYRVTRIDVTRNLPALVAALVPSDPAQRPDTVFNALHGKGGEDGTIPGLLNILGLPYTHSGLEASALAMNKQRAKQIFAACGLRCPQGGIFTRDQVLAGDVMPRPYVIKPPAEGSSFGVHIVRAGDNGPAFLAADWPYGEEVLVERFIPGREMTVAVIDDPASGGARALGSIEIVFRQGFFDYEAKYSDQGAEHVMPPRMHPDALAEMEAMAVAAHKALGCRGVTRADFRYDDTGGEPGIPYLLEVNTHPGMTSVSLVPDAARSQGISFPDLVAWMVEHARCD